MKVRRTGYNSYFFRDTDPAHLRVMISRALIPRGKALFVGDYYDLVLKLEALPYLRRTFSSSLYVLYALLAGDTFFIAFPIYLHHGVMENLNFATLCSIFEFVRKIEGVFL